MKHNPLNSTCEFAEEIVSYLYDELKITKKRLLPNI